MYKSSLPINPLPSSLPLQSSYFRVLHLSQQPRHLRFWDFEKKMYFSSSPIEYRLREIEKIKIKYGSFDHRRIEICKNTRQNFITCSDLRYFKLSHHYTCWQVRSRRYVSIIAHCHWTRELSFL